MLRVLCCSWGLAAARAARNESERTDRSRIGCCWRQAGRTKPRAPCCSPRYSPKSKCDAIQRGPAHRALLACCCCFLGPVSCPLTAHAFQRIKRGFYLWIGDGVGGERRGQKLNRGVPAIDTVTRRDSWGQWGRSRPQLQKGRAQPTSTRPGFNHGKKRRKQPTTSHFCRSASLITRRGPGPELSCLGRFICPQSMLLTGATGAIRRCVAGLMHENRSACLGGRLGTTKPQQATPPSSLRRTRTQPKPSGCSLSRRAVLLPDDQMLAH